MRILFIVRGFAPYGCAEGNLISNIVDGLKDEFEIDVLTTRFDKNQNFTEKKDNVTIYSFDAIENYYFKQTLFMKPFFCIKKILNFIVSKINPRYFIDSFLVNSYFKKMCEIHSEKYDCVIAVSGFFETVVAAMKYYEKKGLNKLFFYQLDPLYTNSYHRKGSAGFRLNLEKKMSEEKYGVFATEYLKEQKRKSGISTDNVINVEFPGIKKNTGVFHNKNKNLQLLYSGTLYSDLRNPEYTLRLLSEIKTEYVFSVMGAGMEKFMEEYAAEHEKINYIGAGTLEESNEMINSADILVNIGNTDINFFPSKIYDYVSTGKPIINICKSWNCPTIDFLNKYGNSVSVTEDDDFDSNVKKIEDFIKSNADITVPYEQIIDIYRESTIEYVCKTFSSELKK